VYHLSQEEKKVQKEFIETNMWLERIQRSKSPYTSGFFLIWKKDGKYHPVQDHQWLNAWTIPNKYPLSLITDLIHDFAGKKLFTKFDIWWEYNNICIKEGDEWKGTFKTNEGLFEPTVMFFGLTNSPAMFPDDDGWHLLRGSCTRVAKNLDGWHDHCHWGWQWRTWVKSSSCTLKTS
jgi:hypothetical protein